MLVNQVCESKPSGNIPPQRLMESVSRPIHNSFPQGPPQDQNRSICNIRFRDRTDLDGYASGIRRVCSRIWEHGGGRQSSTRVAQYPAVQRNGFVIQVCSLPYYQLHSSSISTHLVAFIAEGFYAYRISILAQSYWVPGLVSVVRWVVHYLVP